MQKNKIYRLQILCFLLLLFFIESCSAQKVTNTLSSKDTTQINLNKPEIFTSGFIDVMNNGQVNASARFLRLYIGEPGKFAIPLSFYGGVSNNNFQSQNVGGQLLNSNDHLVNQFINPLSGLINISIDGVKYFTKSKKVTKAGFIYQVGERILTGITVGQITNTQTGKPINFLNSFCTSGLYFQTGAWEKSNAKNLGIFWLIVREHFCYSNPKQINNFLPTVKTNGIYLGYSLGFGIEIDKVVNIKAIYYKYSKAPEIEYGLPIYQFSFNYTMNK